MSIDTTFKPGGPTVAVASGTPAQALSPGQGGTFRIINTTAANAATRIAWGRTAAGTAVPAAAGMQNLLLNGNAVIYLELPQDSFFNVAAGGTIEVTPGQGGVGG